MSFIEIIRTAISNAFRSKLRTTLTVLAIFVGAFTLTITNGIGTGITNYINTQVSSLGADDMMMITQAELSEGGAFGAPAGLQEYDPDKTVLSGQFGPQIAALSADDLEIISQISGILDVEPLQMVSPEYIVGPSETKYEITINPSPPGVHIALLAGEWNPKTSVAGILLPAQYVEALGFTNPTSTVGKEVLIAVRDLFGTTHEVPARIVGVQEETIFAFGAVITKPLSELLFDAQTTNLPVPPVFPLVTATLAPGLSAAELTALKAVLYEHGYSGQTVADQLGTVNTVIAGIIGVLNAFAVVALIAASFGIINTLFMSVQERTREIGLMKAMGMGAGQIFALFSTEAIVIGFLGSAIGALIAIGLGNVISSSLAAGPLSDLAGLRVLEFGAVPVLTVILIVMVLAFLSGTLPAARAAKLDPIEALRYE